MWFISDSFVAVYLKLKKYQNLLEGLDFAVIHRTDLNPCITVNILPYILYNLFCFICDFAFFLLQSANALVCMSLNLAIQFLKIGFQYILDTSTFFYFFNYGLFVLV